MLNPSTDPDRPAARWKLPRLRFSWGARDRVRGEWYGGVVGFRLEGEARELFMLLSVRGLLRWGAGAIVAAYFLGAAGLAAWLDRNPYNQIGYGDLVLPTRWGELRALRGKGFIQQGLHELRHQKYADGIVRLQRGLALFPGDRLARIVLGQLYARIGYAHRAMQIYREGLTAGPNPRYYLEAVFRLATYLEDYGAILEVIAQVERQPGVDPALQRWLLGRRAQALRQAGRPQEVVTLCESHRSAPHAVLAAEYARALSVLGEGRRALDEIERNCAPLVLPQERWELTLAVAQENRLDAVARTALTRLIELDPGLPRYHIAEIGYLVSTAQTQEAEQRIHALFRRFGFEATTGVKLLQRLKESPDRAILEIAWREISATGFALPAAGVIYVEGLMLTGDIRAARDAHAKTAAKIQAARQPDGGWIEGTRVLIDLLLDSASPSARKQFQSYATVTPLTPEGYRFLLRVLRRARLDAFAEEISAVARNRFPAMTHLPPALAPLGLARAGLAESARNLQAPVNEPTPAASAPPSAPSIFEPAEKPLLPRDGSQLAKWLERWMAENKWVEAAAAAEALEKQTPEPRRRKVRLQRIRISAELGDSLAVATLMRELRLDSSSDLLALREMAEDLHGRGKTDGALAIVRDVARRAPKVKWAQDDLRQWQESIRVAPFEGTTPPEPAR